jgi:methylated-DNA-[protein]-cysteine S-methyltransferase
MTFYTCSDSPVGPIRLTSKDGIALSGLYMNEHKHGPTIGNEWTRDDDLPLFIEAKRQLAAYFAGQLKEFDLPLHAPGTPFQQRVWAALRAIPFGVTISYGELAKRIGNPNAFRAVGLANGRNPISIIVPCHRVIGANGGLTGYGGGLSRKEILLVLERSVSERG